VAEVGNDHTRSLDVWNQPDRTPILVPPRFDTGARIGSGCTVLAGVRIGEHALIGAGSLVTRDIPAGVLAYGHPARVHGQAR
jgi:acetyltransferase-like isoleucine patch superfamily enzyme